MALPSAFFVFVLLFFPLLSSGWFVIVVCAGLPAVREKCYFSRSGKSQGILWKVRENLWMGESRGKVREFCDECPQYFLWELTPFRSSFKCLVWIHASQILTSVLMPITISWEENMCLLLTVYWLIVPSIYFASLINFHLLYCEGKSVTVSLEILSVFGHWNFEKKKKICKIYIVSHWGVSITLDDFLSYHTGYS